MISIISRYIKKLAGPALFLAVQAALVSGCSNEECYENQNSLPLAGFYSSEEQPQAISIDSLTILGVGVPGDSILQDSVRSLSEVYLPFRIDQGSTTYEIRYLGGTAGLLRLSDFITFNYDIIPQFVSSACGAVYYYKINSIQHTNNYIDSVTCPGGEITNVNSQNLRIYFRVKIFDEE
ncbi:MAG: hypothetical protein J1E78_05155 [Muribaculaceae bacterium]|nr:hypothetical protein [Muribaculaceae bacterium]